MATDTLYVDLDGHPIAPDQLVWGMGAAAALCGVARMTVWRWVQRGYFVDDVELWNDYRPDQDRPTTVFHKPALLQVAQNMARHCQRTGTGYRPERWGRRQRARIEGRTGRPSTLQRHTRIFTGAEEAALYGFESFDPPVTLSDGLGALETLVEPSAYERIYGTPPPPPRARPRPSEDGTANARTPRGPSSKPKLTPDRADRRTVTATDAKKIWPRFVRDHAEFKATHEGKNPTVRQWAKLVDLSPDETMVKIDERRQEFRNHIPEPPKTNADLR